MFKVKQAEDHAQRQEERYQEQMRAQNNVRRMYMMDQAKRHEYHMKHERINDKVEQALLRKQQQLEEKRLQRE